MISNKLIHVVELIKKRRSRIQKRKASADQRAAQVGVVALGLLSVLAAILALSSLSAYVYIKAGVPSVTKIEELLDPVDGAFLQPTRLYDQTGRTLLVSLTPDGIQRRFIHAADVPWLTKAYVASNQPDFLNTAGFDLAELLNPPNSIAEDLVARVLLPTQPEGQLRNLRTNLLAAEIQERYSADQVLTWALNSMDFGQWTMGAEAGAQLYFGKPASELSLAESALLIAVAQAPALNPHDAPELAISFQRLVLAAMFEQGFITQIELNSAANETLSFAPHRETTSLASNFTDLALGQLEIDLGRARLFIGGLDVTTNIDYLLQQEIDSLVGIEDHNIIVLDPVNDRLLAVSGDPLSEANFGSLIDPFVYLSAFAQANSPASLVWDIGDLNSDSPASFHGPVTLRQSLGNNYTRVAQAFSDNPAIQSFLAELWQAIGIEAENRNSLVNSLDVARAFSVLAQNGLSAHGSPAAANTILFAVESNGAVEYDRTHTKWQSIVSAEISYLVNDVLSDNTFWPKGLQTSRPAALVSEPDKQWQIMYSPQRVIVIQNASEGEISLVASVFEAAYRGLPIKGWEIPAGITSVVVCVPSGQLPGDDCPQTRREWFLRGNEPSTIDALYQRLAINKLNGKLATVFTPAEFVQDRVFLLVPVEAESWAQAAGVDVPPKDYDAIPELSLDQGSPVLTNPNPFEVVAGTLKITGNIGVDAAGYDIQVGQGLRPREWILLKKDDTAPRSGPLADWDTEGLSGIWSIQLQVWDAEGKVKRAYTIVTFE